MRITENIYAEIGLRKKSSATEDFLYEVIRADARNADVIADSVPIQCVVTSPPYWGLRSYGAKKEIGAEGTVTEYLDNLSAVFNSVKEALSDDGTMWVIIGDSYTSGNRTYRSADKKHVHREMVRRPKTPDGLKRKDLIGLPWKLAFRLQEDGWYLRSNIIWHKTNPIPESVKDRPHQSHEHIFLFSKSERYKFDYNALKSGGAGEFNASRNVWACSVNSGASGHAAPFPLDLIKPCILSSTQFGDIVLDPFAGSGSVGVACKIHGRQFLGIDLISENVKLARKRLKSAQFDTKD